MEEKEIVEKMEKMYKEGVLGWEDRIQGEWNTHYDIFIDGKRAMPDQIKGFIRELLEEREDKAREEGRREAVDIMLEKYSNELDIAITEEGGWNYEYYLSKLKDNK